MTVVLFAGHRVDEPDRSSPRFPAECEAKARAAIGSVVRSIAAGAQGALLGIAGAADGGDILFHEVCSESGIVSEVCLALPATEYIRTSVRPCWRERFQRVLESHPVVTFDAGSGDLWLRDHEWQLRRARERNPQRIVLLALTEETEEDIPGGTSGMVRMARAGGIQVILLEVRGICT